MLIISIEEDFILIDKIIGVGEIVIFDYCFFELIFEELVKVVFVVCNGGILLGKVGILEVYVGDGKWKLFLLN